MWLGLVTTSLYAQSTDLDEKKELQHNGITLRYRILFPENYDRSKKYPLVLVLHGAGERGSDNEKQLVHGSKLFLQEDVRKNFPAIVIFPQCPENEYWSSVSIDRSKMPLTLSFDYTKPETPSLNAAIALAKKMINEESVDRSRVYVTGLSMGGMGTFEAVYRYPKLFAAAMPICGGGDVVHYSKKVRKTKFWIFHGDADPVVSVKLSQEMVARLKALKLAPKYTEYAGVQHNSWDNAFAEPTFLSWMFEQRR